MKRILIALLAAGLLAGSALTASAEEAPRSLTVTGRGAVTAEADTATLYVVIESRGATAAEAVRDNAETAARVRNAVIAAGAASDGFSTANYTLWPEYDMKGQQKIKAYCAQNSMKVDVKQLALTGQVSDAAITAGADRIGSVTFSLRDEETYKEEALRRAAADAKKKAATIAAGLGTALGAPLSVTANSVYVSAYKSPARNTAEADAGTTLTPDRQEITAQVTVVYEIA